MPMTQKVFDTGNRWTSDWILSVVSQSAVAQNKFCAHDDSLKVAVDLINRAVKSYLGCNFVLP